MGKSIRVWGDPWLPSPYSFRVESPNPFLEHSLKVYYLIDEMGCGRSVFTYLFHPRDAEFILNIPLVPFLLENVVMWNYSKDGRFIIKTTYAFGMDCRSRHNGEQPQLSNGEDGILKPLWQSPVLPKVMHFMHWISSLSLPTRVNLVK